MRTAGGSSSQRRRSAVRVSGWTGRVARAATAMGRSARDEGVSHRANAGAPAARPPRRDSSNTVPERAAGSRHGPPRDSPSGCHRRRRSRGGCAGQRDQRGGPDRPELVATASRHLRHGPHHVRPDPLPPGTRTGAGDYVRTGVSPNSATRVPRGGLKAPAQRMRRTAVERAPDAKPSDPIARSSTRSAAAGTRASRSCVFVVVRRAIRRAPCSTSTR